MTQATTKPDRAPAQDDRCRSAWLGWPGVWALTLALAAARIAYNLWLSPYELAADEAHYWDWSRHLALSYYTKGPGVAWIIRASTELFGSAEWAVRLPTILASAVTTLAVARLTQRCAMDRGQPAGRAAFLAAVAFTLVPAFLATSMLMTIDMAYIACWALAALAAWELFHAQDQARAGGAWAAALGLAIGVGFLLKYTIILLLPGLFLYRMLRPTRATRRQGLFASALCAAVVVLCIQPVLIWNQRNGWPTIAHLLGHLGLPGGDVPPHDNAPRQWTPMWTVEFVGSQIGIVGPLILLMFAAAWRALRHPRTAPSAHVFLASCALPIIIVYLAVSLITDAEANWPIAGYTTLCALVGLRAAKELPRYRSLVNEWRTLPTPRPKRGILRRKPETPFQIAWHWSIGYALVAGLGMLALPLFEHVPLVADLVPTHRLTGYRARAESLATSLQQIHDGHTRDALVLADRYNDASRMAYYLSRVMGDEQPTVACAGAYLGERRSAYDYWKDTDLTDPRWLGQTVHLVHASAAKWERGFIFERIEDPGDASAFLIGFGYGGPREGHTP